MAASTVETNSSKTYLMYKPEAGKETYNKLIDITDFPDLGSDPEALEVTTLSDLQQRFIAGIKASGALAFNTNYKHDDYKKLADLEGKTTSFAVWFGGSTAAGVTTPTGDDGKFAFDGQLTVRVSGAGTNEVRKMAISIMPSTAIVFS